MPVMPGKQALTPSYGSLWEQEGVGGTNRNSLQHQSYIRIAMVTMHLLV